MLKLYYNFFKKFCDTDKFEELEMVNGSPYLDLSNENLQDVILPKKRAEWDQLRSHNCTDNFTANATGYFFPELAVMPTRSMIKYNRVSSKKGLDVQKCLSSKTFCCYDKLTNKYNLSSKGLNKRTLVAMDQCQSISKC